MIRLILKRFIPEGESGLTPEIREKYGILGGILGIICNLLLFALKLTVGLVINSIAVISDAFNNLSDLGSAFVSVAGSKLSGKSADEEHPYGHGRAEYIAALIISFLIMLVGVELLKSSVMGIINPVSVSMNLVSAILLIVSVPTKLWMWSSNRYMGKKINSSVLLATARDNLNDALSTSVVIAAALLSRYISFPIDSAAGIFVSVMIIWSGIGIAKDTIDRLMGKAPSQELIGKIERYITSGEYVLGMHDLMVHDYGPGRTVASVHAEVCDSLTIIEVHNMIDRIEHQILDELGVDIVIHMDPVPCNRKS